MGVEETLNNERWNSFFTKFSETASQRAEGLKFTKYMRMFTLLSLLVFESSTIAETKAYRVKGNYREVSLAIGSVAENSLRINFNEIEVLRNVLSKIMDYRRSTHLV